MTAALYGLLERFHGHLALLGLAVLLHPVLSYRRKGLVRGMRWSLGLAGGLIASPTLLGWWLYPTYRVEVKPGLLADNRAVAMLFESKEHLAFMCLCLTLGGVLAAFTSRGAKPQRTLVTALLASGWACGLIAGLLGVFVAAVAQPGW